MFKHQNSNALFRGRDKDYARQQTGYHKKNQQFHKQIRRQQIEEKMRMIREEIFASLSKDYQVLKNINLNETIHSFQQISEDQIEQNWESIEKLANDMFLYSKSDQSDHLYYLFDDRIITKITNLLQIPNIQLFKRNTRTYICLLIVAANYSTYICDSTSLYSDVLSSIERCKKICISLFLEIVGIPNFEYKIFTQAQTKLILSVILQSLSKLSAHPDILLGMCFTPSQGLNENLIFFLFKEFQKIIEYTQINKIDKTFIPDIIHKMLNIFQNVLRLTLDEKMMEKVYPLDRTIVDLILKLLSLSSKQNQLRDLQYQISLIIKGFLQDHLYIKPEIINSHNFTLIFDLLKETSQCLINTKNEIFSYNNILDVQGVTRPSIFACEERAKQQETRCIALLEIINVIFGLNIPQENSEKYYETYEFWVESYLLPIFHKIFKINNPSFDQVRYHILLILRNMCLQQDYCDMVLDDLPILNRIFYYIGSTEVKAKIKKAALNILNSIILVTLEGQSQLRMIVIEMLKNNKILEIMAQHIGEFVDVQLNQDLLHSLLLFLRTEVSQEREDHLGWAHFCSIGGDKQLQKYQSSTQNPQIHEEIELIMSEYKIE